MSKLPVLSAEETEDAEEAQVLCVCGENSLPEKDAAKKERERKGRKHRLSERMKRE